MSSEDTALYALFFQILELGSESLIEFEKKNTVNGDENNGGVKSINESSSAHHYN